MSESQYDRATGHPEPGYEEFAPDQDSTLLAEPDGKDCGEIGTESGADLGGHTMMGRRSASQGRRSLFRR